jgi:hypothetical protein
MSDQHLERRTCMKLALALAGTCLLASTALGTVKWDPDPAGPPVDTSSMIADGNYIGSVDKITDSNDTLIYIITCVAGDNPEGVAGRLLIPAGDLSAAQKSTLDTAAAQGDYNNYARMEGDGDVGSVGSSGPYP